MAKVGVTPGTQQLDPAHTMAVIGALGNFCRIKFAMKARPATACMVLALGIEQRVVTADTVIVSVLRMFIVLSTERCLGIGLAGYPVLLGIQLFPPLLRLFDDLFHGFIVMGKRGRELFAGLKA
jgi:hypothetical protein